MKKQLWPGVGLGIVLFLATSGYANPIKETTENQFVLNHVVSDPANKPTGPYNERVETISQEVKPRWSYTDSQNNVEVMAFTSTSSANAAASLLKNTGYSLSFSHFGRVPFYQILMITKDGNANSLTPTSNSPVTTLPEPATLILLGSGLAVLAAGLRKRKPK